MHSLSLIANANGLMVMANVTTYDRSMPHMIIRHVSRLADLGEVESVPERAERRLRLMEHVRESEVDLIAHVR